MVIDTVGVAGLGFLGRGIATCLLAHGFRVIGYARSGAAGYARARAYIEHGVEDLIARAGFPESLREAWRERFVEAASLDDFAPCDFVIESTAEDAAVKQQVFDRIEQVVGESVPIASNTSALPITMLQETRRHPERFLGMHWAEPAHATRFMELIRGARTGDQAMDAAFELGRRAGKDPAVVGKDIPGFIVNRLGYAMYREALHLLETGVADAATIDRSFRNAVGLWASLCGPFRWIDITGGPALYAKAMSGVLPTLCNATEVPAAIARPAAEGGTFYQYEPGEMERWAAALHRQAWAIRALQSETDEPV